MHQFALKTIPAAMLSMGLILSAPGFAADTALPTKPQAQSELSKAVQPQVDKQTWLDGEPGPSNVEIVDYH